MNYSVEATRVTPALIIYLIDCSYSMGEELEGKRKIEHVQDAMNQVLRRMVQRSTKGEIVSPRYRLGLIAYNSQPYDVLGGIQTITDVVAKGTPQFDPSGSTDTAGAFAYARDLLKQELPKIADSPAPMICHLTDGEYNTADPEPIAKEIMGLSTNDGPVLIENIYVAPNLTTSPVTEPASWPGIMDISDLSNDYAKKLYEMSSPLPQSYAKMIHQEEYSLQPGARMLIPGDSYDLIELAFAMSGATPTT